MGLVSVANLNLYKNCSGVNLVILKLSVLEASLLWLAEESLQRRYSQQIQIHWVNQIDSFHVIKLSYTYYDLFFKWNCTTLICYLALIIQYLWIPHKPMANFMVAMSIFIYCRQNQWGTV